MPLRLITISLCLLPFAAKAEHAVTPAAQSVEVFTSAANHLPCAQHIAETATEHGFHESAQTQFDTDYADIEYSEIQGHSLLIVAVEDTPIGAQFSLTLDIVDTDQIYADEITAALRSSLSLPAPTQLRGLATGSAQSWNTMLLGGEAQIFVKHSDMSTQLIALLSPIAPGTQLPC